MQKVLAIYGSGGLGREVYEIALRRNAVSSLWKKIVFINDFEEEGPFFSSHLLHFETVSKERESYECAIAVGEPSAREVLFQKVSAAGITFATLIDPTSLISSRSIIGEGTIVCEFSSIHHGVRLGKNCLIQPYVDIGHDIIVGNHCVFSSHAAPGGNSVFGDRVYIGMQASLKEKLHIGSDVTVAMGAAVFRDVLDNSVVVGNPARITKGNEDGRVFK